MRERSTIQKLLIVMLVALVAMLAVHAAVAKDNPPGCKNPTPGDPGNKNPNCHEGPEFGNCNDGIDNDGDGLTDEDDPDCQTPPVNECTDGIDNDGDGATDGFDRDCDNGSTHEGGSDEPACSNGVDDDGDGKVDSADPGCTDDNDDDETDPSAPPQCSDTVDNDGDGKIDADDPGCSSPSDNDETDPPATPQCSDTIDNDGDGKIDGEDPGCSSPEDNDETDPVTTVNNCTAAAGDPGLLTDDTLGQTLWDGGLQIPPLTEDPEHNGAISGPLNDALAGTDLEVVGDEASCAVDLLLDEVDLPDL